MHAGHVCKYRQNRTRQATSAVVNLIWLTQVMLMFLFALCAVFCVVFFVVFCAVLNAAHRKTRNALPPDRERRE